MFNVRPGNLGLSEFLPIPPKSNSRHTAMTLGTIITVTRRTKLLKR